MNKYPHFINKRKWSSAVCSIIFNRSIKILLPHRNLKGDVKGVFVVNIKRKRHIKKGETTAYNKTRTPSSENHFASDGILKLLSIRNWWNMEGSGKRSIKFKLPYFLKTSNVLFSSVVIQKLTLQHKSKENNIIKCEDLQNPSYTPVSTPTDYHLIISRDNL